MSKYDELRRLAEAAAPGPWWIDPPIRVGPRGGWYPATLMGPRDGWPRGIDLAVISGQHQGDDAQDRATVAYIAAASPDVILALLYQRQRLRAALIDARDLLVDDLRALLMEPPEASS